MLDRRDPETPSAPPGRGSPDAVCHVWYEAYGGPLYSYFRFQLPSPDQAEDLTAEVFLRALRAFEDEGLVVSEWRADLPGPAKRTYTLTDQGRAALAAWLESLEGLRHNLTTFLDQAQRRGGDDVREARPQDVLAGSEP